MVSQGILPLATEPAQQAGVPGQATIYGCIADYLPRDVLEPGRWDISGY